MKTARVQLAAASLLTLLMTGCATHHSAGNAPGVATGRAQSEPDIKRPQVGERFRTETLTPGIGSALFPDPAWR
jgi:hypothetical protein